jgi:hypothetical protein
LAFPLYALPGSARQCEKTGGNMIALQKIRAFLNSDYIEGPQQLTGYIPCNVVGGGTANYRGGKNPERYIPMGASGVTIATGVDLGQTSASELAGMGVGVEIIRDLEAYLGAKKIKAVTALHSRPLTIPQSAADALDNAVHGAHAKYIAKRYNRDAGDGAFEALPWQAQTAVFSLLYQCGCTGGPAKSARLWQAFINGRWSEAASCLSDPGIFASYRNRRLKESDLLRGIA